MGRLGGGRRVGSGARGRRRVYAHIILPKQWSKGTRVCVWPEPHPGSCSEHRYLAGANAPSPTGPGCRARSSWLHRPPTSARLPLNTEGRERSCRQDAPPGSAIVSVQLHDTKHLSQVQVPAAANMLPDEAEFPLGNDSLSARSVQRESIALLGLFPNYRESGHKYQTFPFHLTSVRNVSCKSTMPHARWVLGSQAGAMPAGSRALCMYT